MPDQVGSQGINNGGGVSKLEYVKQSFIIAVVVVLAIVGIVYLVIYMAGRMNFKVVPKVPSKTTSAPAVSISNVTETAKTSATDLQQDDQSSVVADSTPATQPSAATSTQTTVRLVPSVYKKIQNFEVPVGKSLLTAILYWDKKATYKPQLVLIDANGQEANSNTYPGSTFITTTPAQSYIKYPKPGVWAAYLKGNDIPDDLKMYYFIVAVNK
ncbi:hypothetical protein HGB25_01505 [Candidatus Saccharibacteria bacterium]|nr:hypothetical protein [Candidatus Saccharibacteria bacterium]